MQPLFAIICSMMLFPNLASAKSCFLDCPRDRETPEELAAAAIAAIATVDADALGRITRSNAPAYNYRSADWLQYLRTSINNGQAGVFTYQSRYLGAAHCTGMWGGGSVYAVDVLRQNGAKATTLIAKCEYETTVGGPRDSVVKKDFPTCLLHDIEYPNHSLVDFAQTLCQRAK